MIKTLRMLPVLLASLLVPASLMAADLPLELPAGARQLAYRETALGSYALPVSRYEKDRIDFRTVEGRVLRRSWQLQGSATVLQVLAPLRAQLRNMGFDVVLQCQARQCGGFDFRFGIEVVPAPDMVVSLSNYEFVSLEKGTSTAEETLAPDGQRAQGTVASLLVSQSGSATYIQLIEVAPVEEAPLPATVEAPAFPPAPPPVLQDHEPPLQTEAAGEAPEAQVLADALLDQGHVVLEGLVFASGSATLRRSGEAILQELADFLKAHPNAKILIVGHTDTVGSLTSNRGLSLRRARAVRSRLVEDHAVDRNRIQVAGAGYVAPIASNLTAEGRSKNRRVEAVLVSQ